MNRKTPARGEVAAASGPTRRGAVLADFATALRWVSRRRPAGLRELVRPGSVCLEVRAEPHLVTWTLSILAGPTGQVHCLEPLRSTPRWLTVAGALFGRRNIVVHRSLPARASEPGTLRLPAPAGSADIVDVFCRQLSLERVDFINVGVTEAAVVLGSFSTLLRHRPALLVELEDRVCQDSGIESAVLVRGLTNTLGYLMYRWQGRQWQPVTEATTACGSYLFTSRPILLLGA
ncbi:hypothetical protein E6W39_10095 [Kitasatospora acidiphila]|uniref:Uncharacterized protein n=1 Tax=Kitasatospora acidiphila TaxID=2567942 RepID=A0A540W0M8_9ACTN|nr:hypothetical protein [Kitasatospora acidiphila]TQF02551.1 hypothetical protein E6W39_10095 [Kitasatospora acidiphila]